MPEPLAGYDFYFDVAAPVRLPPNVTSRRVPGLVAGHQHLVQVVALTATGRSRPVGASIKVPYPERAHVDTHVEAPVTDQPETVPAAAQPPAPPAGAAPADAAAPPSAGSGSAVAQPGGVLKVKGVLHWLTFGTSKCEGWRNVDDLVHVLDNSGSILAVADIVTKTTEPDHAFESASCEYHYTAVVPAGQSPVYTFQLNIDEKRLHHILRRNKVTVSAASIAGGTGPELVVSDAH